MDWAIYSTSRVWRAVGVAVEVLGEAHVGQEQLVDADLVQPVTARQARAAACEPLGRDALVPDLALGRAVGAEVDELAAELDLRQALGLVMAIGWNLGAADRHRAGPRYGDDRLYGTTESVLHEPRCRTPAGTLKSRSAQSFLSRAGDGIRTHDVSLGKAAFCH
jgi:hypothetical protein